MQPPKSKPPKPMTWSGYDLVRTRSSLTWPTHWRKCIFKVAEDHSVLTDKTTYRVWPRNPEYDKEERVVGDKWTDLDDGWQYRYDAAENRIITLPQPALDPIDFDSYEEIDAWARVAARLDN